MVEDDVATDLLVGAKPIAKFLGIGSRRVLYLTETQRIPTFRIGHQLHARKSTLRMWLAELERAAFRGGDAGRAA